MDPASGAEQVIYRSIADGADGLSIGPGTGRLALFEITQSREGPQPNYTSRLVVLDRRGAVVATIGDDVRVFTWCGEDCVAYITGRYSEDVGFHARGVFVRSPLAGRSTEISGVPSPRRIVWARFDSSLYVGSTRGTIFRSAVSGGPAVATPYKGMAFSPSGKYYLGRDEASDSIRLYETATNRWVPLPMFRTLGEPAGWVFEQGDYLLFGRRLSPRSCYAWRGNQERPARPCGVHDLRRELTACPAQAVWRVGSLGAAQGSANARFRRPP
jgi:hypothetical protein